jgi:hypothetical protein
MHITVEPGQTCLSGASSHAGIAYFLPEQMAGEKNKTPFFP